MSSDSFQPLPSDRDSTFHSEKERNNNEKKDEEEKQSESDEKKRKDDNDSQLDEKVKEDSSAPVLTMNDPDLVVGTLDKDLIVDQSNMYE
jgi:hypothetical protein